MALSNVNSNPSNPQPVTLLSSEQAQAETVKSRLLLLLDVVASRMQQQEGLEMAQMGMQMVVTGVQVSNPMTLQKWLNSLEGTLRAVGKWDSSDEEFEQAVEPYILDLISVL